MNKMSQIDPEKVRKAAEMHGVTQDHILGIIESMQRDSFEKPQATLETILSVRPKGKNA